VLWQESERERWRGWKTYWCVCVCECVFVSVLTTNHSSKTISSFAKDESNAREECPLDGGSFPLPLVLSFNRQLARTVVVLLTDKSNSPVSISSISFYWIALKYDAKFNDSLHFATQHFFFILTHNPLSSLYGEENCNSVECSWMFWPCHAYPPIHRSALCIFNAATLA